MEIMNIREDWNTIPDSSLRKLYRSLTKRQRFLAYIPVACIFPAMIVYGMYGWVSYFVAEYALFRSFDTGVTGIINYVAFAICGVLMSSNKVKTIIATPIAMLGYIALKGALFDSFSFDTFIMLVYLIIACAFTAKTVADLNFLRSLPNFPFDQRDDRIKFEGLPVMKWSKTSSTPSKAAFSLSTTRIFSPPISPRISPRRPKN